jgi:hypothetical protein
MRFAVIAVLASAVTALPHRPVEKRGDSVAWPSGVPAAPAAPALPALPVAGEVLSEVEDLIEGTVSPIAKTAAKKQKRADSALGSLSLPSSLPALPSSVPSLPVLSLPALPDLPTPSKLVSEVEGAVAPVVAELPESIPLKRSAQTSTIPLPNLDLTGVETEITNKLQELPTKRSAQPVPGLDTSEIESATESAVSGKS